MIDPFSKIKSQQIRPTTLHTTNSTIHKISALISSVEEEVSNLFEQHDAFAQVVNSNHFPIPF
jgi:hypothetical protein